MEKLNLNWKEMDKRKTQIIRSKDFNYGLVTFGKGDNKIIIELIGKQISVTYKEETKNFRKKQCQPRKERFIEIVEIYFNRGFIPNTIILEFQGQTYATHERYKPIHAMLLQEIK